ncbi:MAG: hypothetical protein HYX87_02540 [Chloroflexi bacterium]|nr:hypothetical protein [Chloroflexota bacterium]
MTVVDSISDYLASRIPEISYLLASVLMIFASDFVAEHFFIRRLKKMSFLSRTGVFLLYGLLVLPTATTLAALLLKRLILDPYKEWLILTLVGFFLIAGVMLSIRYNIKMRFKVG